MINLSSRLGKATIGQKGAKTTGSTTPYLTLTTTMAKIKLNKVAMAMLGVGKSDYVIIHDLGKTDAVENVRFLITKGYELSGVGVGAKVGTANILSSATKYNAILLNEEGAVDPSNETLLDAGVCETYNKQTDAKVPAEGIRSVKNVRYTLELHTELDEDGNLVDAFSPAPEDGIAPCALYKLVNRVEQAAEFADDDQD